MNLLINPTTMRQDGYCPPPLGLLYMAAMDPNTCIADLALTQENPAALFERTCPERVGVSMFTPGRHESLDILRIAKEHGAITVAGGPHVALLTEQLVEAYPFVDHWVCGDGELAWQAITRSESLPKVIRMPVPDINQLPQPAWEKIDLKAYPARGWGMHRGNNLSAVPRISIVLGRGCDGSCTFCSTWWVNGKYRSHSPEWMAQQLDTLWNAGARHLVFQDDCLTADRDAALRLCDVLSKYNFSWFGTTRVDCLDTELALRMKEVGCYELSFGVESGSQAILERMHKKVEVARALQARAICKQVGIKFTALMMYGYPGETEETQRESNEFLLKLQADEYGSIGHVMVLPGTALYSWCKAAGLIDDSFWLGPEPYYTYHGGLE